MACEEWTPEQGTPQGAVICPLLSNIYLDPLDHLMAGEGFEMVRYADDFVILCRSPERSGPSLGGGCRLDGGGRPDAAPDKTRLVDARMDELRLPGLPLRQRPTLAARRRAWRSSRTRSVARRPRTAGAQPAGDHRRPQSDAAGLVRATSSTATARRSRPSTDGCAVGCEASCASVRSGGASHEAPTISAGPTPSLPTHGLFSLQRAHALACQSP